jgi:hypothetical protein
MGHRKPETFKARKWQPTRRAFAVSIGSVLLTTALAACAPAGYVMPREPAPDIVSQLSARDSIGLIVHPGARIACDEAQRCGDMTNQVLGWAGPSGAKSITRVWFHGAVNETGNPVALTLPWATGFAAIAVVQYQDGRLLALAAACDGPGLGGKEECSLTQP